MINDEQRIRTPEYNVVYFNHQALYEKGDLENPPSIKKIGELIFPFFSCKNFHLSCKNYDCYEWPNDKNLM